MDIRRAKRVLGIKGVDLEVVHAEYFKIKDELALLKGELKDSVPRIMDLHILNRELEERKRFNERLQRELEECKRQKEEMEQNFMQELDELKRRCQMLKSANDAFALQANDAVALQISANFA
jgi:hypothetical protein